VFGGDVFLGRGVNAAVLEGDPDAMLAEVKPVFDAADLVVLNAEGVIASGGAFRNKGEPRPFVFRGHPALVDVLSRAGVDAVTLGNNHAMDYGPPALAEMLHRLTEAGIGYTGGGLDASDAMRPFYAEIDGLVVAVVGADLSGTRHFGAREDRPGTLLFRPDEPDVVVETLGRIAREAREHAHVVVLTPHWGQNGQSAPTEATRSLARRLLDEGGYDAIVGHSAHVFQGVERFDGEPVIYDAGNTLLDVGRGWKGRSFLWELVVDRRGVVEAVGHPIALDANRSRLVHGDSRALDGLSERSAALGTTDLTIRDGAAVVPCAPADVQVPPDPSVPKRPRRKEPFRAHVLSRVDAVPERATPHTARWGAIRLLGSELVAPGLRPPKAGQVVALYLSADDAVEGDVRIALRASGGGRTDQARHIPGDWLRPVRTWEPGEIVRDLTLFRIVNLPPEGDARFDMALVRDRRLVAPDGATDPWVPIGTTPWAAEAERVWGPWARWLKEERGF
jgi:poly-gamma-glutamate capsule biosynthesis protein CapA/YwtB (metallophosphatase superfamily)